MNLLFTISILISTFIYVKGECCGSYTIRYSLPDGETQCDGYIPGGQQKTAVDNDGVVNDIFSKLDRRRPKCWVSVCNDGRSHPGTYCGRGSCNMFGCNCDGGCIVADSPYPLDPYRNFMDLHKNDVKKARVLAEWENWLP
ncbi:hypothetical protein O3G_MSEX010272 [Manduca sexta]|uniref:Protein Diedel-like n=1 Tax=Manduca sexta TaxID=7130 RepID=A0A921ZI10_MANSE|nr:hypothetical protein O3G_MSEX010272 [Manduca sexta]